MVSIFHKARVKICRRINYMEPPTQKNPNFFFFLSIFSFENFRLPGEIQGREGLFLLAFARTLALGRKNNLSFEDRNLHNLGELAELLSELLDLVGVDENGGAVAEVEGVVTGPDVDDVLLLGPTGGHHQLSVAVHLRVLVELRVYVLLPARHHRRPAIPRS